MNTRPTFAGILLAVIATLVTTLAIGAVSGGCATAPRAPVCNPVMEQCNPADYPPITQQLPPWPFPRLHDKELP